MSHICFIIYLHGWHLVVIVVEQRKSSRHVMLVQLGLSSIYTAYTVFWKKAWQT